MNDLLAADGAFVVEVPHAADLIAHNEFDTIYHEHLSEFSVRAIVELFRAAGLEVFGVEALAVHGGSMRIWGQHAAGPRRVTDAVPRALADEQRRGLFAPETYTAFRARVEAARPAAGTDRLAARRRRTVAAYGAPARAWPMACCGLGAADIAYVADRSPLKQGQFRPAPGIAIIPPGHIATDPPDVLLVPGPRTSSTRSSCSRQPSRAAVAFLVPIPTRRLRRPAAAGARPRMTTGLDVIREDLRDRVPRRRGPAPARRQARAGDGRRRLPDVVPGRRHRPARRRRRRRRGATGRRGRQLHDRAPRPPRPSRRSPTRRAARRRRVDAGAGRALRRRRPRRVIASPATYRRLPLRTLEVNVLRHVDAVADPAPAARRVHPAQHQRGLRRSRPRARATRDPSGRVSATGPRACPDESKRLAEERWR
ncbi:MAG: hypothetical protein U0802_06385 [Candidatus Binatia bacterium]